MIGSGAAVDVTADNGGEAPHTITFYADAQYTQKLVGAARHAPLLATALPEPLSQGASAT